MIEACQRKFGDHPTWRFAYGDARDLRQFEDRSFDFVLFSYNGLDYVSHEDRLVALSEIARVCRPGGLFLFSTHNLRAASRLFRVRMRGGPIRLAKAVAGSALRCVVNRAYLLNRRTPHAILVDGAHDHRLRTHYIVPEAQIKEVEAAGFHTVRVFSVRNGEEIVDREALAANTEWWLYYLGTRNS
jgi:SAM-dependent methyltransferase